jgi:hypothetical protein
MALTMTAEAWTATPTKTPVPTRTQTPAPTDPPASALAVVGPASPPDLRATYDDNGFVLTNVSGGDIDVARLVFELPLTDGSIRRFSGSAWGGNSIPPDHCVIFVRVGSKARPDDPPSDVCPLGLESWFSSGLTARFFWDGQAADANTFQVWYEPSGNDPRVEVATCEIAAGECAFTMPIRE